MPPYFIIERMEAPVYLMAGTPLSVEVQVKVLQMAGGAYIRLINIKTGQRVGTTYIGPTGIALDPGEVFTEEVKSQAGVLMTNEPWELRAEVGYWAGAGGEITVDDTWDFTVESTNCPEGYFWSNVQGKCVPIDSGGGDEPGIDPLQIGLMLGGMLLLGVILSGVKAPEKKES